MILVNTHEGFKRGLYASYCGVIGSHGGEYTCISYNLLYEVYISVSIRMCTIIWIYIYTENMYMHISIYTKHIVGLLVVMEVNIHEKIFMSMYIYIYAHTYLYLYIHAYLFQCM
jgi:hypothetical protein